MSGAMVADLYAVLGLKPDEGAWKKGNELVSGMKSALGWFATYEVVKRLTETVSATIELGGHLDDLRQKTGLSAESLQQWGYAATLAGSSMDGIADATKHLARTLKEAGAGSEDANKALRKAGLTAEAVKAAMEGGDGLDAALMEVASRFADMKDGPEKTALAMSLFGKSGAELIPTLNQGAEGLAKLRQEAIDLGVVMSESTVGAADELGDNIDKLKMSVTGLKNQAVSALLPALKDMVDSLLDWVKANKALIVTSITGVVESLVEALKILGTVGSAVAETIRFFSEHATLAKSLIIGLGVVIAAFAIEAAVSWAIAFWPLTLGVAAVAALILIFDDLMSALFDGKGVIYTVLHAVGDAFSDLASGIKDFFVGIGDFFVGIAVAVKNAFWSVISWVKEQIDWAWNQIEQIGFYLSHPFAALTGDTDGQPTQSVRQPIVMQPSTQQSANVRVDGGDTNITIHAQNADATKVGEIVDEKIKEHHDKVWRETHVGTGGADLEE